MQVHPRIPRKAGSGQRASKGSRESASFHLCCNCASSRENLAWQVCVTEAGRLFDETRSTMGDGCTIGGSDSPVGVFSLRTFFSPARGGERACFVSICFSTPSDHLQTRCWGLEVQQWLISRLLVDWMHQTYFGVFMYVRHTVPMKTTQNSPYHRPPDLGANNTQQPHLPCPLPVSCLFQQQVETLQRGMTF